MTAWDTQPLLLTSEHMAALYHVETSTIWKWCATRRMTPAPHQWRRPYRWYRDAVRAHFEADIPPTPVRRAPRRLVVAGPVLPPAADVRATSAALAALVNRSRP